MTPFWTVSLFWTLAALCVAVALAFVLPPLLRKKAAAAKVARRDINIAVYRDQLQELSADRDSGLLAEDQFQTARKELEARLAEDALTPNGDKVAPAQGARIWGFSLAAIIPASVFGLYVLLGAPMALTASSEAQANPNAVKGEHDIMQLIQKVEEKARANPNDAQAWTILAKTYAAVGHWPEALKTYEKAIKLRPDDAAVMSGYAEALAISGNRVLKGKPMELVLKALEKNPDDLKALELAGIGNFQERNYAQAAYYFKRLHKQLPADAPYAQDILEAQKEANRLARGVMTGMDNLADQGASAAAATISGKLDIAPALKAKLGAKDVVFLFARAGEAGPPVAAIRASAGQFPLAFELNDSMAMNPENRLSNFKTVSLTARVAKSGDLKGVPGDLEGALKVVKVGAKDVKLVIDSVRK